MRMENIKLAQIPRYVIVILIGIGIGWHSGRPTGTSLYSTLNARRHVIVYNSSDENNLILTTAIKMPLLSVYRFIRSARSTCPTCQLIIFTNEVNNKDYQDLVDIYNVLFLSYDEHTPTYLKGLTIYSLRFLIYHRYLRDRYFERIFVCDLRDTLFQRNVFQRMDSYPDRQFFAIMESEQLTIGDCRIHNQWISSCYGEHVLKSIYNQSRSCAGSILGTYKGIEYTFSGSSLSLSLSLIDQRGERPQAHTHTHPGCLVH